MRYLRTLLVTGLVFCVTPVQAESIRVIAFNVESGGAAPGTIADQVGTLGSVDIWGFSEVKNFSWAMQFKAAAVDATGSPYRFVFGNTGGGDRLVMLYNQDKLEELASEELDDINPLGRVRAPLVVHFKVKGTDQELKAVVNHLYRKRSDLRQQQARQLREWAETQTVPVIALGDYNFDWESDQKHGQGFDALTLNDVFTWVRPSNVFQNGEILPTQCHDDFRSVLDFVFASGDAKSWNGTSQILFAESDYCPDSNLTSDHRPVEAIFTLPDGDGPEVDELAELKSAVAALEEALEEVKRKVEALENE